MYESETETNGNTIAAVWEKKVGMIKNINGIQHACDYNRLPYQRRGKDGKWVNKCKKMPKTCQTKLCILSPTV